MKKFKHRIVETPTSLEDLKKIKTQFRCWCEDCNEDCVLSYPDVDDYFTLLPNDVLYTFECIKCGKFGGMRIKYFWAAIGMFEKSINMTKEHYLKCREMDKKLGLGKTSQSDKLN